MKFNWVNLLATLLIIGGVILLVDRHLATRPPAKHVPTVADAKADIIRQIEQKLGRPLSDAETDMIEVTKTNGDQIDITLHQPLTGRLMQAVHDAKVAAAATQTSQVDVPPAAGLSPTNNSILHMSSSDDNAPAFPTTGP